MAGRIKRALLLVHRIPYPPDKGDKIRSWRLFRFLANRYELSCGFFIDDEEDWKHMDYLQGFAEGSGGEVFAVALSPKKAKKRSLSGLLTGKPLTYPYYKDSRMKRWVAGQLDKGVDLSFAFSSSMMPYLAKAKGPVFADLVDADSAKWTEYAKTAGFPMSMVYSREGKLLAREEALISRTATHTFLITPQEAAIVAGHKRADEGKVDWYGNGVNTDYFDPDADFKPLDWSPDIIFTGAMDYQANADAVIWFVEKCWPILTAEDPNLTLAIVGARPLSEVGALGKKIGITVTGRVEDMRPWLAAAKVSIAPLRVARGVQNKVLEAMAMARPVVASPGAAMGIEAEAGRHLLVADGAEKFAGAVSRLLKAPEEAAEIGSAARAHVISAYNWDTQLARLGKVLDDSGF